MFDVFDMLSAFTIGVLTTVLYTLIIQNNRNARYAFALLLLNVALVTIKVIL